MIRASHIVKNVDESTTEEAALEAIRAVQAQITADNFAELANEHSDCKGNGGDLGYFPRGQMVDEFDDVVFAMQKPGETSDVFRTPFGFHIARLVDRRPPGVRPLPEVKDEIEELLYRQKMRRAIDELLDRLQRQGRNSERPPEDAGMSEFKLFPEIARTHPCCVPSRQRAEQLAELRERLRPSASAPPPGPSRR